MGDSVVHAIRLYKNAISTLTLQGPGKSLTGKRMFYTNCSPGSSRVKNTRPTIFGLKVDFSDSSWVCNDLQRHRIEHWPLFLFLGQQEAGSECLQSNTRNTQRKTIISKYNHEQPAPAPDWIEGSADETRRNRRLHLWSCAWRLCWYVVTSCPAFPFGFCSLCFVMTFTLYTLDVGVFSLPRFQIGCHYFGKCPCLMLP